MVVCLEQGAYGQADATATPSSLLQKNPERFILLVPVTRVVLEKRPLNDCCCVLLHIYYRLVESSKTEHEDIAAAFSEL